MFHKSFLIGKSVLPIQKSLRKAKNLSTLATTALIVFGVPAGLYTYKVRIALMKHDMDVKAFSSHLFPDEVSYVNRFSEQANLHGVSSAWIAP